MKRIESEFSKLLGKAYLRLKKGRYEIFPARSFRKERAIIDLYETNPYITLTTPELFIVGNNYYKKSSFDKAIKIFNKIISQDSKNIAALNNLGISYLEINNYEKAKIFLDMAININPEDSDTLMNLGAYYIEIRDYPRALVCFNKLFDKEPEDIYILKVLGTIYANLEEYDNAKLHLERALEFSPNDMDILNNLGVIADIGGNIIKSLQIFSRISFLNQNYEFSIRNVEVLIEERKLCNIKAIIDDYKLSIGQDFQVLFKLDGEEYIPKNAIIEYGFFGKIQLVKYFIPGFKEDVGGFIVYFDEKINPNFILFNEVNHIEYLLNCDKNVDFKKAGFKREVQFDLQLAKINNEDSIYLSFPLIKISKMDFKSLINLDLKNINNLNDNEYIKNLIKENQEIACIEFQFKLDEKTQEYNGYDSTFHLRRGEGVYW